ncbi:MAG: type II restriction endonuclease [Elusimicrobia bacterium]|nr:type II restriction endonuclease [Elusimicrobiota bacterium]
MKHSIIYEKMLKYSSPDDVFKHFMTTLKPSTIIWTYFVNWEKVFESVKDIEVGLNVLNYLIGKQDFDKEFRFLLKKHPEVAQVLPTLVVRDGEGTKNFKILVDYKNKKLVYEDYDFSKKTLNNDDIEKYLKFITETGFKNLIVSQKIKNLVDYMIGVEAGLDSNGRKNRGGSIMEDIVEVFIKDICERHSFQYLTEASAPEIKARFNKDVPVDKSSRRYDFVVYNGKEIFIIEVNFYSGGGSKLKSTAGEYRDLFNVLKDKHKFIWITDGYGWKKTDRPLRETFEHNDYLLNLDMLEKGILENLILNEK